MSPKLMVAVTAIMLALIFYTIGVWSEHKKKLLTKGNCILFWIGLIFDTTGTSIMATLTETAGNGTVINLHGITGWIAILLMIFHAIWATVVLVKKQENLQKNFHKFSIFVWAVWLIPFILGMVMGMMK